MHKLANSTSANAVQGRDRGRPELCVRTQQRTSLRHEHVVSRDTKRPGVVRPKEVVCLLHERRRGGRTISQGARRELEDGVTVAQKF